MLSPPARSSVRRIRSPRVRNAVSRRRWLSVSYVQSTSSKISASGRKAIVDLGVGQEGDRGAGVGCLADDVEVGRGVPAHELLAVELAVALDLGGQPLRERIHNRDADAVEAARDLVGRIVAAELAAGVELGQHHGQRGDAALVCHRVDRDPGAVVTDRDRIVRMDDHVDRVSASREGLVDAVVDRLEDEVMEPSSARRADVHARAQPDGLETLENGDVFSGIGSFRHEKSPASSAFPG